MQRHSLLIILCVVAAPILSAAPQGSARAAVKVVASIKPVHGLVAAVMTGVGEPALLIQSAGSPHSYHLRPSQARALARADLVFWVGEAMETFLAKPLDSLVRGGRVIELAAVDGIALLETREGGAWGDDDVHAEHNGGEAQAHGERDMHIWLDPRNAKAMVRAIVAALSDIDPANGARYAANGATYTADLERLDAEIAATLAPVRTRPYVVFHDAYHYFEARYGTNAVGAITVSPERPPGARRLAELRGRIAALGASCVFSEPQFEPALVDAVVSGTSARTAELDPLGTSVPPGPQAYVALMRDLAAAMVECLSPES